MVKLIDMTDNLNKKILKGTFWSFIDKVSTEVIQFFIVIILTRLLLPSDYGSVALVQIFITFSTIFVTCGLGVALIQNRVLTEIQVSTIFYLNFFIGIILYGIVFFIAPFISLFFDDSKLVILIRVLAISIPISSIYNIQYSYFQKQLEFKKIFFSSFLGTAISGAISILMAYKGFGVWALITNYTMNIFLDMIFLFIISKWIPKFQFSIDQTKEMLAFGKRILIAELISRMYDQIYPLAIGKKYSNVELAYNNKGQTLPNQVIEVASNTLIKVMFPTFSMLQDDPIKLKKMSKKVIKVSSFVLTPILVGMAAISNQLVPVIFTDKWVECIPYLQIYCLTLIFQPIHILDLKIIQACGKSKLLIKMELLKKGLGIIFLLVALFFFKSPLAVAISFTFMSIGALIINTYPCKKLIDYGIFEQLLDCFPAFTLAMFMGLIVYLVGRLVRDNLLALVVQIILGILFYATFGIKLKGAQYILNVIYMKIKNKEEKNENR